MINIKTAIQNNRSLIGVALLGCGITYLLAGNVMEHQKLTARLDNHESNIDALFGILEDNEIIQNVKTN